MPPEHQSRRAAREAAERAAAPQPVDKPKRSTAKRVWTVVGIVAVVLLAAGVWLGFKALAVKDDFEAMQAALDTVADGGDTAAAIETVGTASAHAAANTNDPVWRVAEFVPALGDNFRALRLAANSIDILANDVGTPVLEMQADGQGEVLARALPLIETAGDDLTAYSEGLVEIADSPALIGPVGPGIEQLAGVVGAAQPLLTALPELLGADGAKNYLLVFQNNAESLALGGSAASQALVTADAGDIAITNQASSGMYDEDDNPVDVDVDYSAVRLYGIHLLDRVNTSVSRPDFPTAAELLRAWWQRDIADDQIDGVISIDPIALGRVLLATGPLTVGDIEINSDNAVDILLSQSYEWWNPYDSKADAAASDAFFAIVAAEMFEKVASGDFNLKDMAWAVSESIDKGSIMAWSDNATLASVIEGERVAGVLPTTNDEATTVGVFFRDASGSKIDYYMDSALSLAATCADGTYSVTATTDLHLDISQADADQLPTYVQSRLSGSDHFRTEVHVYGPPGTTVASVEVGGVEAESLTTDIDDLGRPVAAFATTLPPAASTSVTATFTGTGEFGPLEARVTPMVNATDITINDACA